MGDRHDLFAAGNDGAHGSFDRHGEGSGTRHTHCRFDRNHNDVPPGRDVEDAPIDGVAIIAIRIEDPQLIAYGVRIVRGEPLQL
jgi:hypothetical protein